MSNVLLVDGPAREPAAGGARLLPPRLVARLGRDRAIDARADR